MNRNSLALPANRVGRPALVALLALLPVAACTSSRITVPELKPQDMALLQSAANDPRGDYRVEPGDTLSISFPFQTEMNQQALVRPDGTITANLVGDVTVAGHTTGEIEELLRQKTSDHLRDPEVDVTVTTFAPKYVFVTGEVDKPGMIPYRDNLTPLQAVIDAGGFTNSALVSSVILVRSAGSQKNFVSRRMDLTESVRSGAANDTLYLAPHDVVYVPRTRIADVNVWVDQHITQLFPFLRMSMPFGF
jgi:polysaccharide biosynthesis/export protein PslD